MTTVGRRSALDTFSPALQLQPDVESLRRWTQQGVEAASFTRNGPRQGLLTFGKILMLLLRGLRK